MNHFLLCPKKKAKSSSNLAKNVQASSLIGQQTKLSVLLQAHFVSTTHCSRVGTFLDVGLTDNYVTHRYTEKHELRGKDIDVEVESIGGKKSYVQNRVYTVPILI